MSRLGFGQQLRSLLAGKDLDAMTEDEIVELNNALAKMLAGNDSMLDKIDSDLKAKVKAVQQKAPMGYKSQPFVNTIGLDGFDGGKRYASGLARQDEEAARRKASRRKAMLMDVLGIGPNKKK